VARATRVSSRSKIPRIRERLSVSRSVSPPSWCFSTSGPAPLSVRTSCHFPDGVLGNPPPPRSRSASPGGGPCSPPPLMQAVEVTEAVRGPLVQRWQRLNRIRVLSSTNGLFACKTQAIVCEPMSWRTAGCSTDGPRKESDGSICPLARTVARRTKRTPGTGKSGRAHIAADPPSRPGFFRPQKLSGQTPTIADLLALGQATCRRDAEEGGSDRDAVGRSLAVGRLGWGRHGSAAESTQKRSG